MYFSYPLYLRSIIILFSFACSYSIKVWCCCSTTDVLHYAAVYTAHLALGWGTLSKGLIPLIGYTKTTNLLKMVVWTTVLQAQRRQFHKYYYTHLENNKWNSKNVPLFNLFEELIITPRFVWRTELGSAHTYTHTNPHCRQYLVFSRSAVIPSKGRREAVKFQQPAAEALICVSSI